MLPNFFAYVANIAKLLLTKLSDGKSDDSVSIFWFRGDGQKIAWNNH